MTVVKTELQQANEYICAALSADSELSAMVSGGIHLSAAPYGVDDPWIVFSALPGNDSLMSGGGILKANLSYTIKAVTRSGCASDIDPIASAIQRVLHATSKDGVLYCQRIQPYDRQYYDNGDFVCERGGIYDIRVQGV